MRILRSASLLLTVVLAGCGTLGQQNASFDFSQRDLYQTSAGQDTTLMGILQGASRPARPPGGMAAPLRPVPLSAVQATGDIPSVDGNYQLVMGNDHLLLLGSFPELEPYIGRAVTITGKVVVFNLFDGSTSTQLAPHFVTFGTP